MKTSQSSMLLLQKITKSLHKFQQLNTRTMSSGHPPKVDTSNLIASLENKARSRKHLETNKVCIYRVPEKMRHPEPMYGASQQLSSRRRAYDPNFISVGPYHCESPRLQAAQGLKWTCYSRLFGASHQNTDRLGSLLTSLKNLEGEARSCYAEDINLNSDRFVEMMLLDGCFITELFRELSKNNFTGASILTKRWMLPVVRRDLIMLENQLPLFVLKEVFSNTSNIVAPKLESSLEELAIRFFDPLMPMEPEMLEQAISKGSYKANHFTGLFRSSLIPDTVKRGKEPHMCRTMIDLTEAGVKIQIAKNRQPLDITFTNGKLQLPPLHIDDHTGSLYNNILAYEQCHPACEPDVTSYLFFFDKLINCAEDVRLLHHARVLHHCLGSKKQVARLVNTLCIEVEHDGQCSYLYETVDHLNNYLDGLWAIVRGKLKHDYFSNPWAFISTSVAILFLYLTLLEVSCEAAESERKAHRENMGFWIRLNSILLHPISRLLDFLQKFVSNFEAQKESTQGFVGSEEEGFSTD